MAKLTLHNVTKKYGRVVALNNLSFEVADKEFLVLLGPSGAGKTTTLKVIAGVERLNGGVIFLDDHPINALEPHERNIAMAFESYALYPHMTVYENLAFPLRNRRLKISVAEIDEKVQRVAEILNIHMLLERKPVELSNGQKQRVALGRTMVREPKVFLLDEPLSHLDAKLRHRMRAEFKRLGSALNTTVVYVTHDYMEALSLADRIAVIDKGVLQQVGTPEEVLDHPVNEFVAAQIGQPEINIVAGSIGEIDGELYFVNADQSFKFKVAQMHRAALSKYRSQKIHAGIRPLFLRLTNQAAEGRGIVGRVYVFELVGTKGILTLKIGRQLINSITPVDVRVSPNESVKLEVDSEKVVYFDATSKVNVLAAL